MANQVYICVGNGSDFHPSHPKAHLTTQQQHKADYKRQLILPNPYNHSSCW
jgi:hypothetical protein